MANRGPLSKDSTMTMFNTLMDCNSDDGFLPFLGAINKELEFLQLEVKKVMNQYNGEEFYGLINTLPSKEAKLGTRYSPAQITFFRAVVETIVQDPKASGVLSSTAALNLKLESHDANTQEGAVAPIRLSMQAREEALGLLAANQLLGRKSDGGVILGVKAFLELRSMFRNLEVPFCAVCNEAAIKAQLCRNPACTTRLHIYCVKRKFHSRKQKSKCSECGAEWKQPTEESDADDEEETTGFQNTPDVHSTQMTGLNAEDGQLDRDGNDDGQRTRRSGKRIRSVVDDDRFESQNGSQSQPEGELSSQRTRRMRGQKHVAASSNDDDIEEKPSAWGRLGVRGSRNRVVDDEPNLLVNGGGRKRRKL